MKITVFLLMPPNIHQIKSRNSEVRPYPLYLGNISKDFKVNSMKKIKCMDCVRLSVDYNRHDIK